MSQPTILAFPGLAANQKLFLEQQTHFGEQLVVPQLPAPGDNDTLRTYAQRVGESLLQSEQQVLLLGVSFGAQLALELSFLFPENVKKTIAVSAHHLPTDYTFTFRTQAQLSRYTPSIIQKLFFQLGAPFFALLDSVEPKHKTLLTEMAQECDMNFFKWAAKACLGWEMTEEEYDQIKHKIVRIHGLRDWVIPPRGDIDYSIPHRKHLIIYSEAEKINEIIRSHL